MTAQRSGDCPTQHILNPLQGDVEITSDEHRIQISALYQPGLKIDLSADTNGIFVHRTSVFVEDCSFEEQHRLSVESPADMTTPGEYELQVSWQDTPRCSAIAGQYTGGLDKPCTMTVKFLGERRP